MLAAKRRHCPQSTAQDISRSPQHKTFPAVHSTRHCPRSTAQDIARSPQHKTLPAVHSTQLYITLLRNPPYIHFTIVSIVNTNTILPCTSCSPKSSLFSIVFLWKFFISSSNTPTPVAHLTFHHLFTLRIFCKDFRILDFLLTVIPLLPSLRLPQVHTSPSVFPLTKFCQQHRTFRVHIKQQPGTLQPLPIPF